MRRKEHRMKVIDGKFSYHVFYSLLVGLMAAFFIGSTLYGQSVSYSIQEDGDQKVVIVKRDTARADTIRIEVQLERELERIREELERTRERLKEGATEYNVEMQVDMEELIQELRQTMEELEKLKHLENIEDMERLKELEQLEELDIHVSVSSSEKPFLGVSIEDLDFEDAYEMHYDQNYGVYVSGVVPGSSADRAGIRKGDILMEFDGDKIRYSEILKNMIDAVEVGDTVEVKLFRNEDILTTDVVFLPKRSREVSVRKREPEQPELREEREESGADWDENIDEDAWEERDWEDEDWSLGNMKDKFEGFFSAGYGGGSWIPVWSMVDLGEINGVIDDLGFKRLPENGILMQGGLGKGPIGKGWFIGGMGASHSIDRKISHEITRPDTTFNAIRRMQFSTGYGGVTLDKRYRLSKNALTGFGFLLGGGDIELEVSQTSGHYDWKNLPEEISESGNSYLRLTKSYLTFQPKAMFMYRLTSWFAIRAEAGYLLGYSFKSGWDAKMAEDNFEIEGSPSSQFYDGFTFSIGPWFGF